MKNGLEASGSRWINKNSRLEGLVSGRISKNDGLEASRSRWIDKNSSLENLRRRWIDKNSGLEPSRTQNYYKTSSFEAPQSATGGSGVASSAYPDPHLTINFYMILNS